MAATWGAISEAGSLHSMTTTPSRTWVGLGVGLAHPKPKPNRHSMATTPSRTWVGLGVGLGLGVAHPTPTLSPDPSPNQDKAQHI